MKNFLTFTLLLALIALASCKGRYADGTPNGETVEVDIQAFEVAEDTLYLPAADSLPAPEQPRVLPAKNSASDSAAAPASSQAMPGMPF